MSRSTLPGGLLGGGLSCRKLPGGLLGGGFPRSFNGCPLRVALPLELLYSACLLMTKVTSLHEKVPGPVFIHPDALARAVERTQINAGFGVPSIASSLVIIHGLGYVAANARSPFGEHLAKVETSSAGAAAASLIVKRGRPRHICGYALPLFVEATQLGASSGDPTLAGFFVKRGPARHILGHANPFPSKPPKVEAAHRLSAIAGFLIKPARALAVPGNALARAVQNAKVRATQALALRAAFTVKLRSLLEVFPHSQPEFSLAPAGCSRTRCTGVAENSRRALRRRFYPQSFSVGGRHRKART